MWGFRRRLPGRSVTVAILSIAAGTGLLLCACSGGREENRAPTTPEVTGSVQQEAAFQSTATPEARRPWSFLGQRSITAAFPPADVDLYRALLPKQFDMPEQPLVAVSVVDYYDVTLPLVPYHEGYVAIQCRYQGRTGWHVLTMPVDDETSEMGGRSLGFPKYIADEITLEEQEGGWLGRVVHQGRTVLEVAFSSEGKPVTQTGDGAGTDVFQLVPPGEGPALNEVRTGLSGERTTTTISGSATVRADAEEPWAGLLGPGGRTAGASFEEVTGYWWLEPTRLE